MRRVLFAMIALAAACGGDEPLGPVTGDPLPPALLFVAEAQGVDAGLAISCSIETIMMLDARVDRSATRIVQYGTGGGDARRNVLKDDGSGVGFWAHTYFPDLQIHLIGADSIEVRSPIGETATERFWREFAFFAGHRRNASPETGELARGSWTCRPMDTPPSSGGYYDPVGTIPGTWVLRIQ
jgi:hypothetical protein